MKKLFFTAIVLVAFSSVSMANTIEEEVIAVRDCAAYAANQATIEELKLKKLSGDPEFCLDSEGYNNMYNYYYGYCVIVWGNN